MKMLDIGFLQTEPNQTDPKIVGVWNLSTVPRTQARRQKFWGSPDPGCGTVCPLNCDSKTFASPSLGGYLETFLFRW